MPNKSFPAIPLLSVITSSTEVETAELARAARVGRVEVRRVIDRQFQAHCEREYKRTGEMIYAWEAIVRCLRDDQPLPEWANRYLLEAGTKLVQLAHDHARRPAKGAIAPAIAKALGGRRNPFNAVAKLEHEILIACEVYMAHSENWGNRQKGHAPQHDWDSVYIDAAKKHAAACGRCRKAPGKGTVERYWRKHALRVIPRHLVDRAASKKIDDILR